MIFNLLQDLKGFLDAALAHLWQRQPGPGASWSTPRVFIGSLPDKVADRQVFPFVVIEPAHGGNAEDRDEATLVLTCGVYTPEDGTTAGLNEVFNLMTRTRQAVLSLPGGILKQRYELTGSVRWRMDGAAREEGHPYYWGRIETTWAFAVMVPGLPDEVIHDFGSGSDIGL